MVLKVMDGALKRLLFSPSLDKCEMRVELERIWSYVRLFLMLVVVLCAVGISGCSILKRSGSGEVNDNYKDAVPRVDPLSSGANKPYTVNGKRYVPDTREVAYRQKGVASWYGKKFHGRQTSTGEIYNMYEMTAAHKTLPLPSYVHVTNVKNGRSVIVRVNDRGPFSDSRLIDLSYAAAVRLDFVNDGLADVIVERIMPADIRAGRIPATTGNSRNTASSSTATSTGGAQADAGVLSGGYYVQIAAFQQQTNANMLQNSLANASSSLAAKLIMNDTGGIYKVYAGPYSSEQEALSAARQIESLVNTQTLILDRR